MKAHQIIQHVRAPHQQSHTRAPFSNRPRHRQIRGNRAFAAIFNGPQMISYNFAPSYRHRFASEESDAQSQYSYEQSRGRLLDMQVAWLNQANRGLHGQPQFSPAQKKGVERSLAVNKLFKECFAQIPKTAEDLRKRRYIGHLVSLS